MKRLAETFGKELRIGDAVLHRDGKRTVAVKWAKKKYGRSERNIWKCVALAKRSAARKPTEEKPIEYYLSPAEISQIKAIIRTPGLKREVKRMTSSTASFLIRTLIGGPRRATEVTAMARADDVPLRTLQRAVKLTGFVKISRVGGRNGHWSWELSERAKNILGTEI
jgi:hypothetical protein